MNPLYLYSAYRRLRRAEREDPGRLRGYQSHLLRRMVTHAYESVPFYRRKFDAAGIAPAAIRDVSDIAKLPIVTKAELQEARERDLHSSRYHTQELTMEHTSGSTGSPLTLAFDPHYVAIRNAAFLRAMRSAGYTVGRKLMLVTATHGKRANPLQRWQYAAITDPPAQLVAEYNAYRPEFLYGCTTPLRLMAEHAEREGIALHRPRAVMTTAELLDDATRAAISQTFGAEVFDLYGLTEMGMVGWECSAHDGYHLSDDSVLIEVLPHSASDAPEPMVMTNLHLYGMPMIRFQTGDIGHAHSEAACPCGRRLRRLAKVEGRLVDCITLADGRSVSPYRLTCAIENLPGIQRYQVVQEAVDRFTVFIEPDNAEADVDADAVRRTMRQALESDAHVDVQTANTSLHTPGRKFRVVESRVEIAPAQ